ncbi:MAG: hypothetical protein HW383_623 [Candidatus Magasanikbacteria bacterium]|nr:hypothetical protein [Candidatus Magasanikbacteria bacterium]
MKRINMRQVKIAKRITHFRFQFKKIISTICEEVDAERFGPLKIIVKITDPNSELNHLEAVNYETPF